MALPQGRPGDHRPGGQDLRLRKDPLPPPLAGSAAGPCGAENGLASGHVEHRRLGRSGLTITEIAYGNWLTHGSQVEEDAALACVHAALDAGITTFDTADVYAGTKAESVLGEALAGQRREGLEIFTKVYWPTGPGHNDRGLSPQAHHRELPRIAAPAADRLRRPLPGPPLRRARRRSRRR